MSNYISYKDALVDISVDADLSLAVDLEDRTLVGIITPSNFDGTDMVLHVSHDNVTFYPLAASNAAATAYTIVTTASTATPIDPVLTAGWRYLKVETTTDQATNDTTIILALKEI